MCCSDVCNKAALNCYHRWGCQPVMSNQHLAWQRGNCLFLKTVPIKPLGLASVETFLSMSLCRLSEALQITRCMIPWLKLGFRYCSWCATCIPCCPAISLPELLDSIVWLATESLSVGAWRSQSSTCCHRVWADHGFMASRNYGSVLKVFISRQLQCHLVIEDIHISSLQ